MRRKLIISLLTIISFVFAINKSCYAGDEAGKSIYNVAISSTNNHLSNSNDTDISEPELGSSNSYSTDQLKSYKRWHPDAVSWVKSNASSSPDKSYSLGKSLISSSIIFLLIFPFHAFW